MEEKKTVFVTGASRGIGKEVALKYAENGYDVIINYVSDKTDVEALEKEFKEKGADTLILKADVSNPEEVQNVVDKAIEKFGKIDVLVNNAGITRDNLLMRMSEEEFDKVLEINLKGTFLVTKAVTKYMMKKRSGSIINLSSVVGVAGNAGQCNYSASKAGIIGFTKSIAKELASRNIRANAVAPGFIETDMTAVLSDSVKESIHNQIPLKRMGSAKEVAELIYFLGSEKSSYITGQVINVDGGMKETIKGIRPADTQTDYALAGGIMKTIYNTEIKVDKQGQEITSVVSRQEQFENETHENFSQVVQNISSITTTIQTTGGGNAIHNSVGYNKDTDGTLVGWTSTGTVASETSPESLANGALSGNQIDLGVSSSITQRIAVDSSGSVYTLSFRAKKSVVGQAKVHLRNSIDDYVVNLPNGTDYLWEQFELVGVKPSESYFDLVVETDSDTDYFAVTDLMLTVGDSITPWVQASDEILSKNVALDTNGVKVSSSTSNDYVKLDELGLNGYSDAGGTMENVFTINRDMTEVSKLRSRKQIEMPPLKVIPIDTDSNSGWAFVKIGE